MIPGGYICGFLAMDLYHIVERNRERERRKPITNLERTKTIWRARGEGRGEERKTRTLTVYAEVSKQRSILGPSGTFLASIEAVTPGSALSTPCEHHLMTQFYYSLHFTGQKIDQRRG